MKKLLEKLKKSKVGRIVGNVLLGVLNSVPVVSNYIPSVQNFNETIDDADLNEDGSIAKVKKGQLAIYYILNHLVVLATVFLIIWGIAKGLDKETIEWAVKLLNSF